MGQSGSGPSRDALHRIAHHRDVRVTHARPSIDIVNVGSYLGPRAGSAGSRPRPQTHHAGQSRCPEVHGSTTGGRSSTIRQRAPCGEHAARPLLQPEEVLNTVVWLMSDQARWITGVALPVDRHRRDEQALSAAYPAFGDGSPPGRRAVLGHRRVGTPCAPIAESVGARRWRGSRRRVLDPLPAPDSDRRPTEVGRGQIRTPRSANVSNVRQTADLRCRDSRHRPDVDVDRR